MSFQQPVNEKCSRYDAHERCHHDKKPGAVIKLRLTSKHSCANLGQGIPQGQAITGMGNNQGIFGHWTGFCKNENMDSLLVSVTFAPGKSCLADRVKVLHSGTW
jgi:hypothetical protein